MKTCLPAHTERTRAFAVKTCLPAHTEDQGGLRGPEKLWSVQPRLGPRQNLDGAHKVHLPRKQAQPLKSDRGRARQRSLDKNGWSTSKQKRSTCSVKYPVAPALCCLRARKCRPSPPQKRGLGAPPSEQGHSAPAGSAGAWDQPGCQKLSKSA